MMIPTKSVLGSAALFLILAIGAQASADTPPAEPAKAKAEERKPAPEAETKPEAAAPGTATATAAKEGSIAEGKGTTPPASDAHAHGDENAEAGAEARGPRRMDAAQEAYRRAREKFLHTMRDRDPKELSEEEKKGLEMAQNALEKARARLQASHLKKPSERMDKAARATFEKRLEELNAKRQKDREARANEQRAELKKQFKEADPNPAVAAELKHHAWRVARLLRLKELASAGDRSEILKRVELLLEKESARHEKHLAHLAAGGAPEDDGDKKSDKASEKTPAAVGLAKAAEKKDGVK